ncbi:MAG: ATP-binding protein [Pseudomonadota bacterium]
MDFVFGFLQNLALLALLGMGYYVVENARPSLGTLRAYILHGLVFGLTAFLVTAAPLTLNDGATLDARAGPVVLAGVVGGPIGAVIAAAMGALARGLVGGNFAFSGIAVYGVYGLLGLAIGMLRIVRPDAVLRVRSIAILAVATCAGSAAMFFLISPYERAVLWLQNDLPLIWAANILSVAFTCLVVGVGAHFVRKNAQLSELNERLALAKRAGQFGIWDYNVKTGRLQWDTRSAEMHGLGVSHLDGAIDHWLRYVDPDDLQVTEAAFQRALESDEPFSAEYRVHLPDDQTRIIKGDAIVLRDVKGEPERVVGSNLDLTEVRQVEADLAEARSVAVQAQKFDTIGKMTGGVAHDFNNLLAIIMGNQELMRDEIAAEPVDLEGLDQLIEASLQATRRGADLTQNLLAYARQAQLSPEPLDLNRVVRQTETWLRRAIESRVEIECAFQAGIWNIRADRASLQSALINLVINARDALEGPGKVTIETANVRIDSTYLSTRAEDIPPGRYVMLAVSDTGPGIPEDVMQDIFDPFFTTKPVGKGTGLGLSMVQGFVKQSGGTIRVYSEPGVGASFKLYFPVSEEETPRSNVATRNGSGQETARGNGRLLVVEDQDELLSLMREMLLSAGYDVVTATSGDLAFATFEQDQDFDLVATDIVMPGTLQGPALARAIRAIDPEMPFVFFSGYAREAVLHGNGLRADDVSLTKPVARHDLLSSVADRLAAAAKRQTSD